MITGRTQSKVKRGKLVAQLLAGAWRCPTPSPVTLPEELAEVATLLMRSGAGSLAWWRVRQSGVEDFSVARELQETYRFYLLQAALHERRLKQVVSLLRSHGVEPLLVKGWATARHYPEPGLRQYCDLDLCVLPDQFSAARAALENLDGQGCNVDLHVGFDKFYDRESEDVFARSHLVSLDDVEVRVLCAEDDLRFLCVHMLRHGAVRPLWLCDIAVLLERRAGDFDWDLCLGRSGQQADWVACAIGLAHQLLGAEVAGTPVSRRAGKLPTWLVPAVLKEWGTPFQPLGQVAIYLRRPLSKLRRLPTALSHHWPNPIEATVTLRGPFNEIPRLPFQIGHVFSRTASLMSYSALMSYRSRLSGASSS
jgi:hypothetical protein